MKFKILFFSLLIGIRFSLSAQVLEETTELLRIDYAKSTLLTRFSPPDGYKWIDEEQGSFGEFLVNFPLYPKDFPVRDYNTVPVERQDSHASLLKIDVGGKDLQQCADAWIRLYAEYQWKKGDFEEIIFQFTSGQYLSWLDYSKGIRTKEVGERVHFYSTSKVDSSRENFRNYLNLVFNYAGTISLEREGIRVEKNSEIKTGDYIIKPGSPGHCVIIMGRAKNKAGKMVYLLAESFMPAQDIHLIKNPFSSKLSPWYELDVNFLQTKTAKYTFKPTLIKRYYSLFPNHKKPLSAQN